MQPRVGVLADNLAWFPAAFAVVQAEVYAEVYAGVYAEVYAEVYVEVYAEVLAGVQVAKPLAVKPLVGKQASRAHHRGHLAEEVFRKLWASRLLASAVESVLKPSLAVLLGQYV